MASAAPTDLDRPDGPAGAQAVRRALDLLTILTDCHGSLGLSDVVARSGMSMATTHRLLKTLESDGYVRQYADRSYSLGPRLLEIGRVASTLLPDWTEPYLQQVVDRTGETANLAVLDADEVVYVGQVRSRQGLQMAIPVGARLPAHSTAAGKVLLAALPDAYVESVLLRTGMPMQTPCTLTEPHALLRQLSTVRRKGFAVDLGEQEVGVNGVAVPVRPSPRNLTLSVSGPAERMTARRQHELARILIDVARAIGVQLQTGAIRFGAPGPVLPK